MDQGAWAHGPDRQGCDGADAAAVSPSPGADVQAVRQVPGADAAGMSPVPVQMWRGCDGADAAAVRQVLVQMWERTLASTRACRRRSPSLARAQG